MDAGVLLHAHDKFVAWCRHKETVLAATTHLFPEKHPLRTAVSRALCGDPLGSFRLQADNAACHIGDVSGRERIAHMAGERACVDLFYGASLRALVEKESEPMSTQPRHSQWLSLADFTRMLDTIYHAESFMNSVRALTSPPRIKAKLDSTEQRFRASWERALMELRAVAIDAHALGVVETELRRLGLPAEISSIVQKMLVGWPVAIADPPPRKRRRLAHRP